MITFQRNIEEKIRKVFFKGNIISILGPRQAGKTTLSKSLIKPFGEDGMYFDCQIAEVREHFLLGNPDSLKKLVGKHKIVVFDEAQTIQDIGSILKVFHDTYPHTQIIATGSSSFDLANKINEPMTGRVFEFILLPLSISEIKHPGKIPQEKIFEYLYYGMYPAVVATRNHEERELVLKNLVTNYLYKDVFVFESIRNPRIFEQLVKQLAFQVGHTVSVNELALSLGISRSVVQKYLRLLEQSFIIKVIYSFSTNPRVELKKAFKVFFYDNGVRNALVGLGTPLEQRNDRGAIWENFFFSERSKIHTLITFPPELMFWRTRKGLEIDFIEKDGQNIIAYECKWQPQHISFTQFLKRYSNAHVHVVSPTDMTQKDFPKELYFIEAKK